MVPADQIGGAGGADAVVRQDDQVDPLQAQIGGQYGDPLTTAGAEEERRRDRHRRLSGEFGRIRILHRRVREPILEIPRRCLRLADVLRYRRDGDTAVEVEQHELLRVRCLANDLCELVGQRGLGLALPRGGRSRRAQHLSLGPDLGQGADEHQVSLLVGDPAVKRRGLRVCDCSQTEVHRRLQRCLGAVIGNQADDRHHHDREHQKRPDHASHQAATQPAQPRMPRGRAHPVGGVAGIF